MISASLSIRLTAHSLSTKHFRWPQHWLPESLEGCFPMEFADKDLRCITCDAEFVFSAGEQQFFLGRGFTNLPKHCKQCKANRTEGRQVRPETQVKCAACGRDTTVPFKPTQGRPVLCRTCFNGVPTAVPSSRTA